MGGTWKDSGLFASAFSGLKVQVISASQVVVTASEIFLKSSTEAYLARSVSVTLDISTSGAGGLDTGSESANTWYYVWVIYNGSIVSVIASASSTSPTLPSGYTFKVRAGAVRNDASSNLYRTIQYGKNAQYVIGTNPTEMIAIDSSVTADISTPIAAIGVGAVVPATASRVRGVLSTVAGRACAAPNGNYGAYNSTTNPPPVSINPDTSRPANTPFDFVLESTNIYWASNSSNGRLNIIGWEDNL